MKEEIVIDIDAQGNVRVEASGVIGPDCQKLTAAIEHALGTVSATKTKPEFSMRPPMMRKVGA